MFRLFGPAASSTVRYRGCMKRIRVAHLCDTSTSTLKKGFDYYTSITGIPVPEDVPEPIASQLEQAFALSKQEDITLRMAIIRVVGGDQKSVIGGESVLIDRFTITEGKFKELDDNVERAFNKMHDSFVEEIQRGNLIQQNTDMQSINEVLSEISNQIIKISKRIECVIEEVEDIRQLQNKKPKFLGWWPW